MTYNVHQLLHLQESVEELGPLWSHSCFFFEDLNGDFRDLFHGTQNIDGQVFLHTLITQLAEKMKNSSPKKLSADCWPTVGRQSANSRPTVGRQSTDSRPTVGRLLAVCRPTVGRLLAACR